MTFSIPMPLILIWLTGLIGCGGYEALDGERAPERGAFGSGSFNT